MVVQLRCRPPEARFEKFKASCQSRKICTTLNLLSNIFQIFRDRGAARSSSSNGGKPDGDVGQASSALLNKNSSANATAEASPKNGEGGNGNPAELGGGGGGGRGEVISMDTLITVDEATNAATTTTVAVRTPIATKAVTVNESRRKKEDNLAAIFMGFIVVFLVCHLPRLLLNIHELATIEHAMDCQNEGQKGFPLW